jgi:hypothetical protein
LSYFLLPLGLIAFVGCIWGFIELYFLKGSRKTNRFGPDARHAAALGPAERDRNDAVQGWPAAGLAC